VRRRTLISGFGATISVVLLPRRTVLAQANKKVVRIGFLGSNARVPPQPLLDGLRERGWKPDDFVLEARWAEGRPERFPAFAAELVALRVDVIFASSPPAVRAAQQATRTIPIIMFAVADPVQQGFITSLSRPGGNITGVSSTAAGLFPKLAETTKEAIPSATRIGILYNQGNPLNYVTATYPEMIAASDALGLQLVWLPVREAGDFEEAFVHARQQQADAIIGIGDPLLMFHKDRIHDLAERHRIPMVWPTPEYVAGRGLLSYGPSLVAAMRYAAGHVDRVLRGEQPATMPVEQPTDYKLVLNLKTARALGLTLPPTLIARADEVIE
jgi:putative tryptophan/tyrosine transport system substrate-binding protein